MVRAFRIICLKWKIAFCCAGVATECNIAGNRCTIFDSFEIDGTKNHFPRKWGGGKKKHERTKSDTKRWPSIYIYFYIAVGVHANVSGMAPKPWSTHTAIARNTLESSQKRPNNKRKSGKRQNTSGSSNREKKHNCFRPRRAHTSMDESRRLSAYHFHYGIQYQISLTQISDKRVYLFE